MRSFVNTIGMNLRRSNRIVPILSVFIVLCFVTGFIFIGKTKKKDCHRCNILILDIDVLRADELPCFGYQRDTTPNLCAYANKSTLFTQNFSSSIWTLPSIFSTITSLYPTFHRVRTEYTDVLSPEIPTMAEVFHRAGYQTVYVGHPYVQVLSKENGGLRGYDRISTRSATLVQVISELEKDGRPWFIHYYNNNLHMPYLLPDKVTPIANLDKPSGFPLTQADFDQALNAYLYNHLSTIFPAEIISHNQSIISSAKQPGSTALADLFYKLKENETKNLNISWEPLYNTYMQYIDPASASDAAYLRMIYDTKLKILDSSWNQLFHILNTKPVSDNTVVVAMSEHGEAFGEHGVFAHVESHHTELFHTPLIVRVPGFATKKIEQATSNMDVFPTLLDLTGIPMPSGLQGRSLIPSILNPKSFSPMFIMSENYFKNTIIQNQEWLYYVPYNAPYKNGSILYNKRIDPFEENNIAAQYPELTQSLYNQVRLVQSYDLLLSKNTQTTANGGIKINSKTLERLQKEGYF